MKKLFIGLIIGVSLTVPISYLFFSRNPVKETRLEECTTSDKEKQKLPQCDSGKCPTYFSWDVDGDTISESLVIIPTAMTQGAGKIWIIDDGELVFDSGEYMGIWAEEVEDGNGFILIYKDEVNTSESKKARYIYKNGEFKLKNKGK